MSDPHEQIPDDTLRLTIDDERMGARIKVIGVGGGGGNAVARCHRWWRKTKPSRWRAWAAGARG